MAPPPIPRTSLERAVAFLNTWDTLSPEPDRVADTAILGRFLRWVHDRPEVPAVGERDLAAFRRARGELRRAFDADDEDSAVAALNAILDGRPVTVQLARDDGEARLSYRPVESEPIDALLTESAIQQGYANDYSALFAAMTITMIPTLIVYVLFQRRLESGLTAGALKG